MKDKPGTLSFAYLLNVGTGIRWISSVDLAGPVLVGGTRGRLNMKDKAVKSRSSAERGKVTTSIFLLLSQVKLPKRLELKGKL